MKALIVEDEPLQRLSREHQIQSLGFECTSCVDAETALEACRQTFYQLIVTDLGLPGMDGLEFCQRIRSLPHGEQSMILVVSGRNKSKDLLMAFEAGADDYLIKPVSPELLGTRLMVLTQRFNRWFDPDNG